jgi:hypothetical protein
VGTLNLFFPEKVEGSTTFEHESHCDYSLSPSSDSEITATPILDNPHLILLFYLTQLFLRELVRSYHLLKIIPMDMSGYFGERKTLPRAPQSHFATPNADC